MNSVPHLAKAYPLPTLVPTNLSLLQYPGSLNFDATMTDSTEQESNDMKSPIHLSPARASTLLQNLSQITSRITSTSPPRPIRLVAVSKLKPASDILSLHAPPPNLDIPDSDPASKPGGHAHFGENYVQELLEKSKLLPRTIKWHFIGGLQSNKCAQLARECDSLWAVESVDSEKKANLLNKGRGERNERLRKELGEAEFGSTWEEKLRVFVQVNTSGEESKSGVEPTSSDLLGLAKFIRSEECPNLHLQGLMTIGAIARSQATTEETENEDFLTLRSTRDNLAHELGIEDKEELELSMGMSEDFESAVRMGSSEVRVGSTIFGERPAKKDARVVEDVERGKE